MKRVELYGRVRHAVMIEGLSQREAARCFGIDPRTVRKMLSYSVPPGYVRTRPPVRPKLDPFIGIIDRILEEDKDRPKKQRHTSKRIFERLRDEYGFTGKITIVKDYICGVRQIRREPFDPSARRSLPSRAGRGRAIQPGKPHGRHRLQWNGEAVALRLQTCQPTTLGRLQCRRPIR